MRVCVFACVRARVCVLACVHVCVCECVSVNMCACRCGCVVDKTFMDDIAASFVHLLSIVATYNTYIDICERMICPRTCSCYI